jgi:hypothetical protein
MAISIEKGRPAPRRRAGAEEIVPELAQMEVGDSIFIPNQTASGNPAVSALGVGIYGVRVDRQFETRYEDDGLRVWRTR